MTAAREALTLPAVFLTVALFGGLRVTDRVALVPPPLFALVLSVLLIGLLVRCGACAPDRLVHPRRPALANLNGAIVMLAVFLASAQAFNLATPDSGVPRLLVSLFFLVLLANTLAASPDRVRVLRSLFIILGSAFVVKFVVLTAMSSPGDTLVSRMLRLMLDGATFGAVTQGESHAATGYVAFATLMLYVFGLALLPTPGHSIARSAAAKRTRARGLLR